LEVSGVAASIARESVRSKGTQFIALAREIRVPQGDVVTRILRPMRRGATLPELSLTLILLGLMLVIALPRIHGVADSLAVSRAARAIAAAHTRARMAAVLRSQALELVIEPGALTIRPAAAAPIWQGQGPAADEVILAGPPRTLTFSPVGITTGLSNASFRLTRGEAERTVIVSRLGRVRIVP
jgi:Tfp pilus assembly protein FimT